MTTSHTLHAPVALTIPEQANLPASLLSNIETGFKAAFEQAEKWRQQALAITVTSLDQKAEMKMAYTIRQELKKVRVAANKTRKDLKADALLMGRAIDGVYNVLEAAIVPLERHLIEQEKYVERLTEAERLRLKAEREAALAPYITEGQIIPALEVMTEEVFSGYLADAKLLHEAKIEAAKKAKAERIAREQAEAAERERIRQENEKLRREAAEREEAMRKEREAAEAERKRVEAAAAKEREEAAAKLRAEQEKAAAAAEQKRVAAEAARVAAEKARKEREAREKAEAEALALRQAEEARAAEEARKQAAALAEQEERQRREANAPDKEKLLAFAASIRSLTVPTCAAKEAQTVTSDIVEKVASFATWIENKAARL